MQKRILVSTIALLALAFFPSTGFAKDAVFDPFWIKFQTALKNNDKEAIASMTKLPYQSYKGTMKSMDKKAFIAYCGELFPKKTRDCLVKQKPVKDKDTFSAFCGEDIFIFEKVNGTYLFTEVGVND